jgi:glycosyltransferase involved in cell wall biosynthesis
VADHEKIVLRKKLRLPLEKTVFIFTGKITRRKGIDILLRAWQRASNIQHKALLLLVGSGAGQSDNLEEWARRFVKEHGLSNTVIFAGEQKYVHEYLASADCFVFPSRREGLSNSLLEAMASGLTCIVSAIGGNADLVKTGETGVLVPTEEIDCWCQTIQNAALYPTSILGLRATKLIVEDYSINVTVSRIEHMYQQGTGLNDL